MIESVIWIHNSARAIIFKNLKKKIPIFFILILVGIIQPFSAFADSFTWTERTSSGTHDWKYIASSSDGTKVVATSADGYIYRSSNSGANWTALDVLNTNWRGITSSTDGTNLAAVADSVVYTSSNSGTTWTESYPTDAQSLRSITSSSDWTKLIVADTYNWNGGSPTGGYIYTGEVVNSVWEWTKQTGSGARYWTSLATSSDGVKIVAAENGGNSASGSIYTSTDSGVTWSTNSNSSGSRNWQSITSSSTGSKLAAVVEGGYIYTSTNSGTSWSDNSLSSGSRSWRSIASSTDGTKLAAVDYGGYVYVSKNSGASWSTKLNSSGFGPWAAIASSSDGTKLVAGGYNTYLYTTTLVTEAPNTLISNDDTDGIVKDADTVIISAMFDEDMTTPTISIDISGGTGSDINNASMTIGGDLQHWTYSWNVPAGNTGATATVTVAGSSTSEIAYAGSDTNVLTIDNTAPTISTLTSDATAAGVLVDNDTITFTATPSIAEPTGSISGFYNGQMLVWMTVNGGVTYTATYTVTAGDPDQTSALQISGVILSDAAGNESAEKSGTDVVKTIDASDAPPPEAGSVPEFSTFILLLTIAIGGWFMYTKRDVLGVK